MGNTENTNLQNAISHSMNQSNVDTLKYVISPSDQYAELQVQSLPELFPVLTAKLVEFRKKQSFTNYYDIVRRCPLYFLKEKGCYYQGQWDVSEPMGCLPHGCGVVVYVNETYCEGEYVRGQLTTNEGFYFYNDHGMCQFDSVEASKCTYYIGAFQDSKYHGKGRMYHQDIAYNGQWIQGQRYGEGVEESCTQKSYHYKGSFKSGFKDGEGIETKIIQNKTFVYDGFFQKGRFHGECQIIYDGQLIFRGNYQKGFKEGNGELFLSYGRYKGEFKRNHIEGQGKFTKTKLEQRSSVEKIDENYRHLKRVEEEFEGNFYEVIEQKRRKIYCDEVLIASGEYIDLY